MTSPPVLLREPLPVEFMNTVWADRDGVHDTLADARGLARWLSAVVWSPGLSDLAPGRPALDGTAPDGTALDGTALDGTALDGTALDGTVVGATMVGGTVVELDAAALDGAALGRFRALRDALRVLAAEVTGDPRAVAGPPDRDMAGAVSIVNLSCAAAPSWSHLAWPAHGAPSRQLVTGAPAADSVLAQLAEAGAVLFGSGQAAQLGACLAPGCVLYFLRDHPRRQWCSDGCGNRARVARHYARHHAPSSQPGTAD